MISSHTLVYGARPSAPRRAVSRASPRLRAAGPACVRLPCAERGGAYGERARGHRTLPLAVPPATPTMNGAIVADYTRRGERYRV